MACYDIMVHHLLLIEQEIHLRRRSGPSRCWADMAVRKERIAALTTRGIVAGDVPLRT